MLQAAKHKKIKITALVVGVVLTATSCGMSLMRPFT